MVATARGVKEVRTLIRDLNPSPWGWGNCSPTGKAARPFDWLDSCARGRSLCVLVERKCRGPEAGAGPALGPRLPLGSWAPRSAREPALTGCCAVLSAEESPVSRMGEDRGHGSKGGPTVTRALEVR